MRYESVDTLSFTDHNGRTVSIKDKREYPSYQKLVSIPVNGEDQIDEIASRIEVYGAEGESQSYKIVDNNITKLFERDFDLSKIPFLEVPV